MTTERERQESIKASQAVYRAKRESQIQKKKEEDEILKVFQDSNVGSRRFGSWTIAVKRQGNDEYNITASLCSPKDNFSKREGRILCAQRFNGPKSITVTIPNQTIGSMLTIAETIIFEDILKKDSIFLPQGK